VRVLHVNKFLYRKGGAEGYMEDLGSLQERAGATVGYWGMDHPENTHVELADTFPSFVEFDDPPPGVVERTKMVGRMVWSLQAQRGMAAAIEAFRPDVAHLHNVYHQLSPSILSALLAAQRRSAALGLAFLVVLGEERSPVRRLIEIAMVTMRTCDDLDEAIDAARPAATGRQV